MKQIEELHIHNCQSLTSLPISSLPNTLKEIEIRNCGKLKLESSVSDMFLDNLILYGCDSIDEISLELVPRARSLHLNSCHNLRKLLIPSGTEFLEIFSCENLEIFSVACEELKSLPERMHELLPSLKELSLHNCPKFESFSEGGLPFNVETLSISDCEKLVNGRKEWRLQGLTELWIFHDGSDEEVDWELPASIRNLTIYNMKTLSSKVLRSLTSLEALSIGILPLLESLLEEGLPTSLSKLTLNYYDELHSLPTEALRRLTSLRCLGIMSCNQLESLPESALPSSLSKLTIWRCPNLKSLPINGMPSSISTLTIRDCPLLKQRLEFDKGKYWPKIAHIPTIEIDDEYL